MLGEQLLIATHDCMTKHVCIENAIKCQPVNAMLLYTDIHVLVVDTLTSGCQHFTCQSTGHCIFKRYRCDRFINCFDASDELGCGIKNVVTFVKFSKFNAYTKRIDALILKS